MEFLKSESLPSFEKKSTMESENYDEENENSKNFNSINENCFSSEESREEYSLKELELLIENLLDDKITLQDLPNNLKSYESEMQNIPKKPRMPEDVECCGSGCSPCVWDTYDRDSEVHQRAVDEVCEKIIDQTGIK